MIPHNGTRSLGKRHAELTDFSRTPFTKVSFLIRAKNKQGLTDSRAATWWQEYYDDPGTQMDNSGYQGAEVLYSCKGKRLTKRSGIYIDGHTEESGWVIKNAKEKDMALRHLAHDGTDVHGSSFFRSAAVALPPPLSNV